MHNIIYVYVLVVYTYIYMRSENVGRPDGRPAELVFGYCVCFFNVACFLVFGEILLPTSAYRPGPICVFGSK